MTCCATRTLTNLWGWMDPPKSAEGMGGVAGQTTLRHLSAVLANRVGPR